MKRSRLAPFFLALMLLPGHALGQADASPDDMMDDDLAIEGDIFNDFNEDLEASQVLEDERFYRYGRFFQANVGLGLTTFTGNRGKAYTDNHPTFHLSVAFFMNFRAALTLGVEYSKHTMFIDTETLTFDSKAPGAIETSMFRPFVGARYYIDTTDLGTAVTYSNPHFIGRIEYWYQSNKFIDDETLGTQKGGGIGFGGGFGLEFPVELKVSYISVEFLYHKVAFFDRFTRDYEQDPRNPDSTYGYDNLTGDVLSLMMTYNFTW